MSVQGWAGAVGGPNSSMAMARQAHANGMPEPPEIFFETQSRILKMFQRHGETRTYNPHEVVMQKGAEVSEMMVVEEGSVVAEKDVTVMRRAPRERPAVLRHGAQGSHGAQSSHAAGGAQSSPASFQRPLDAWASSHSSSGAQHYRLGHIPGGRLDELSNGSFLRLKDREKRAFKTRAASQQPVTPRSRPTHHLGEVDIVSRRG